MYMSKNVCIDGYIDSYKGKPQIEATSEIMITIKWLVIYLILNSLHTSFLLE